MLRPRTREQYRQLPPEERLRISFELIEAGWPYLSIGSAEQVARKRELWQRENEIANQRIVAALTKRWQR